MTQKTCSICNRGYPDAEFTYGNRENRSYCRRCDKEEKAAYASGGVEAATRFREEMRRKWKVVAQPAAPADNLETASRFQGRC